jgi:hypothetical protein
MYSFRRLALVLALFLPASFAALGQSSSTSSSEPTTQDQVQPPVPAARDSQQGKTNVQSRIRLRREQRRAQTIHDTYSHLYEVFVGGGYIRMTPGPALQRLTMYSWDVAVTRYFNERLGITIDGRGYYGTAYVGLNPTGLTRPAISHYDVLGGPTYRFIMHPKYSVSGRVMGGLAHSNFASDTNGFGTATLGLYPDSNTYAISAGVIGEVNVTPTLSLRLAPEYFVNGFGSTLQGDPGFTYGFVYRFGKQ